MQNTNIVQGSFVSNGLPIILDLPMGVDWMEVWDYSQYGLAGSTPFPGLMYYWQLGMPAGDALMQYKNTQTMSAALLTFGGFTFIDTTQNPNGAITSVTGDGATVGISISAASPRVVTIITSSTPNGLALYQSLIGISQVRLTGLTGAMASLSGPLLAGKIWSIDGLAYPGAAATVTFNLSDTKTGANNGTLTDVSGSIVPIKWSPYWYPRVYNIYEVVKNSTNNAFADVYTTVQPSYQLGQSVRFNIPKTPFGTTWGMPQLNGLVGNVVAVPTAVTSGWVFTVDIDVSAFGGFTQPGDALMPLTTTTQYATVTPVGDVAAQIVDLVGNPIATNKFDESEFNQGFRGMYLGTGGTSAATIATSSTVNVSGPAGVSGDVMYWKAGKSFSNQSGVLPNLPPFPPLGL